MRMVSNISYHYFLAVSDFKKRGKFMEKMFTKFANQIYDRIKHCGKCRESCFMFFLPKLHLRHCIKKSPIACYKYPNFVYKSILLFTVKVQSSLQICKP